MCAVSCVLLLETCKLGLIEDCIIIASNYVIFPWNWFIFTYTGPEDDTIEGPLVIHWWDLTSRWAELRWEWTEVATLAGRDLNTEAFPQRNMLRGNLKHIGISLESRFLLLELLTVHFRSSQTIGSNLWFAAFIFAFLPYCSKLSEYNRIGMWCLLRLILRRVWLI